MSARCDNLEDRMHRHIIRLLQRRAASRVTRAVGGLA